MKKNTAGWTVVGLIYIAILCFGGLLVVVLIARGGLGRPKATETPFSTSTIPSVTQTVTPLPGATSTPSVTDFPTFTSVVLPSKTSTQQPATLTSAPSQTRTNTHSGTLTRTRTATLSSANTSTPTRTPTLTPTPLPAETALTQTADPVFVGAGDIANCSGTEEVSTAQLLDSIAGTVFTLGDNAYPDGTLTQFMDCYGPTWGRHKDRTRPAPGNHDYHTAGAAGYYTYFGAIASPLDTNCTSDCKGYYSYNLGAWHIIALNSEIDHTAGSVQEQWLRADLIGNQSMCTLAYWHKPRFSSGTHGNNSTYQPFWQALYDYGADVVLNGHDHTYERFAPQSPTGQADPTRGIRAFVVGTGGAGLYTFPTIQPNSKVRENATWGVLKLTLHATSYDWEFAPIAGQTFTDAGSDNCVNVAPSLVTGRATASTRTRSR